jgi:hypothetical protein
VDIEMRAGRREAAPGEHFSRPNKDANYLYYNLIFFSWNSDGTSFLGLPLRVDAGWAK